MEFIKSLLPLFETLGNWGYLMVLAISLAETLPLIGLILPGAVLVGFFGLLSAEGYLNVYALILFASIGAILGDNFGYWLGTKGTRFFRDENKILKASHLVSAEKFFEAHGNKSVFLARFVGALRPIIPFVAGLSRMRMKTFMIWNALGGVLWSAAFVLLGYFFGNAFVVIERWWGRITAFGLGLLVIVALIAATDRRGKNGDSRN